MGFFDSLVDTSAYQSQLLTSQPNGQQGIAAPVAAPTIPTGMAKGGLTGANQQIEQVQIMKVIANYFKNNGIAVEPALQGVKKEMQNGLQLIPFENSVMGFKPLSQEVAQIHFFTVGTMRDLANDMEYFYTYLKDKGIKTVYDSVPAPITVQILARLGAQEQKSDNPKYKYKASI